MTDRKPWVISILPVKCPDDMTGIPNYYIQIWEKYVGKVKPEGGDREDWIETCYRLYWGVRNLGEDAIVRVHGKTDLDSKRLIGLPHFGQVLNMPPIDQYADPSHADRYAINPNVRMLMHRKTKLSSIYEDDIKHAFASLIKDGVSSFFIKFMNQAKLLPNLKISGTNLDELEQQVQEWGGWAFVRADDDPNALLIQENVDIQYEYRMFMVGNQPVCGAGNIGLTTCIRDSTLKCRSIVTTPPLRMLNSDRNWRNDTVSSPREPDACSPTAVTARTRSTCVLSTVKCQSWN